MKTPSISTRYKMVLDYFNLSAHSFSTKLGHSRSERITRILKEEGYPSYDVLRDTITQFPEINAQWLLTGKGEMIQNTQVRSNTGVVEIRKDAETAIIPFVPSYQFKNYCYRNSEATYISALSVLEEDNYNDSVYRDFEVPDDKQAPFAFRDDIIRCQYISEENLNESTVSLMVSNLMVFVLEQKIILGVASYDFEHEKITIKPINSMYNPQEVDLMNLQEVWKCVEVKSKRRAIDYVANQTASTH